MHIPTLVNEIGKLEVRHSDVPEHGRRGLRIICEARELRVINSNRPLKIASFQRSTQPNWLLGLLVELISLQEFRTHLRPYTGYGNFRLLQTSDSESPDYL